LVIDLSRPHHAIGTTTLSINGTNLEFRVIPGPVEKPTLVFLHEGLGCVALWRDFPDKLARRLGLRAVIYSRRGYGQSAPLDASRTPDFMHVEALDVLPQIRRELNIERAIFIGHSDGASIALIHAASDAVSGEGFETTGLVLMAPHIMVEPISISAIAAIRETYTSKPDLKSRLARYHAHVDDAFLGWADAWLSPAFQNWSLLDDVKRLKAPTLLIQGTDDAYGTLAQIEGISGAMPGRSQSVVLTGVGHSPFRDAEDATLDAISGFAARLG
jgi:pimeloyl-ACP methyl ester carboxylesterase